MKNFEPVRTVLVGCGAVSNLYYAPALELLQKSGLLQVVALVDPNGQNLARIAQNFPQAFRFDTVAGLSRKHAEFAIVASPPRFHAEQSIALLQAGLAVLCEKPMATNTIESEAMLAAASRAQRILAIGLVRRFFPATQMIRDILSNEMIGEIVSFRFTECSDFRWPVASADFFQSGEGRGGVLLDIGVHVLDLLLWWWGQPNEITYEDDAMGGNEANCRIRVRFESGFSGEIRLSRDWPVLNQYVVHGTRGWVCWEVNESERLQIGVNSSPYVLKAQLHERREDLRGIGRSAVNFHQSFVNQIRDVIDAIRTAKRPTVCGEEGLKSVKLIEQCYKQRRLIAMPWLCEAEHNRAIR